ncbi:MAG: glycosyltransferase [Microbacteriaceae bacterium]|nr:glycosyltransferase [Microbacteriaceae bacterium]
MTGATRAPSLAIVIINFNTRDDTLKCLESLAADGMDNASVTLVDNGSVDGSVEAIASRFPLVKIIEAGENLGFARGVNLGVRNSDADYIVLLNPDTTVFAGSLEALRSFAVENPLHGLYGGRTIAPNGHLDPGSCWGAPTIWSLLCYSLGLSTVFRGSRLFDPESLGKWQRDTVREVPIITGCLLLMRRDQWLELGGLDEDYFLYGEDAEFSLRARSAGYRPVIVPTAVITHALGASTSSNGLKMCMILAGKVTLFTKQWSAPAASVGIVLLQGGALLRAFLETVLRKSNRPWGIVWSRRRDWRSGYPAAKASLFGLRDEPTSTVR